MLDKSDISSYWYVICFCYIPKICHDTSPNTSYYGGKKWVNQRWRPQLIKWREPCQNINCGFNQKWNLYMSSKFRLIPNLFLCKCNVKFWRANIIVRTRRDIFHNWTRMLTRRCVTETSKSCFVTKECSSTVLRQLIYIIYVCVVI